VRRVSLALVVVFMLATLPVFAQTVDTTTRETREQDVARLLSYSEVIAQCLSVTIGTAISPLVGITAISAVGYFWVDPDGRGQLPWYNQPRFWLWTVAILGLVALKDTVGGAVPLLKKPLDALELFENQGSALVALPVVIPTVIQFLEQASALGGSVSVNLTPVVYAQEPTVSSSDGLGLFSWLVVSLLAIVGFVVVWFTGHVANVLVFLNFIPFVDTLIKGTRLAFIGLIVAGSALSPIAGIVISLLTVWASLWLFGWSFRLTHLGTLMGWDILTKRGWTFTYKPGAELAGFTAARLQGLPPRTYGGVRRTDDERLELRYRRFLVLPESTVVFERPRFAIGQGMVSPTLVESRSDDDYAVLFRFLPRYRGDEAAVARSLSIDDVIDVSAVRGVCAAGKWLQSLWQDESVAC